MKRRFKTSYWTDPNTTEIMRIYEPTIQVKDSVMIDDKSFKKSRGWLHKDSMFLVPTGKYKVKK